MTGMADRTAITVPQNNAPGIPPNAKAMPMSVPCAMPTTTVPLSVARATEVKVRRRPSFEHSTSREAMPSRVKRGALVEKPLSAPIPHSADLQRQSRHVRN
jgi:hypothetical protein